MKTHVRHQITPDLAVIHRLLARGPKLELVPIPTRDMNRDPHGELDAYMSLKEAVEESHDGPV